MVVHGRNLKARDALFTFLRALGLAPVEWEEAIAATGMSTPHNLEAVRAAMEMSQAVVVLLTAEDQAGLLPALTGANAEDMSLRGQPRQNVILEAGIAIGIDQSRTILVQLGTLRSASDFDGLNTVRLTNAAPKRQALRSRLSGTGCAPGGGTTSDWLRPETGGDFDAAVVEWTLGKPGRLVGPGS
jgi:predicted nucleotide-binding protein